MRNSASCTGRFVACSARASSGRARPFATTRSLTEATARCRTSSERTGEGESRATVARRRSSASSLEGERRRTAPTVRRCRVGAVAGCRDRAAEPLRSEPLGQRTGAPAARQARRQPPIGWPSIMTSGTVPLAAEIVDPLPKVRIVVEWNVAVREAENRRGVPWRGCNNRTTRSYRGRCRAPGSINACISAGIPAGREEGPCPLRPLPLVHWSHGSVDHQRGRRAPHVPARRGRSVLHCTPATRDGSARSRRASARRSAGSVRGSSRSLTSNSCSTGSRRARTVTGAASCARTTESAPTVRLRVGMIGLEAMLRSSPSRKRTTARSWR